MVHSAKFQKNWSQLKGDTSVDILTVGCFILNNDNFVINLLNENEINSYSSIIKQFFFCLSLIYHLGQYEPTHCDKSCSKKVGFFFLL